MAASAARPGLERSSDAGALRTRHSVAASAVPTASRSPRPPGGRLEHRDGPRDAAPVLDTLSLAEQLVAGGVAQDQAKAIARAIHDGLSQGGLVTTVQFEAGLAGVRAEIAGEIAGLDRKFTNEIAAVREEVSSLHTEIAGLHARIAGFETRLLRWVVVAVLTAAALTVGILRFSL